MMNPWDKERTFQQGQTPQAPSRCGGSLWLIAIVIAVVGLAMLGKHGLNNVVVIPIGISIFFMVMFLVSHRRENRRIAWHREATRMQPEPLTVQAPRAAQAAVDTTLRKVFDRYDVKVINHGRSKYWNAEKIAGFLDYARDYVDTQHATALINSNEKGELDRHLDASLHRALLQHDIENKTAASEEPPF